MGYADIATQMAKGQERADKNKDQMTRCDVDKYKYEIRSALRAGHAVRNTLNYLGISPDSKLFGELINRKEMGHYNLIDNDTIAVRTTLSIKKNYASDMKRSPLGHYVDKQLCTSFGRGFYDIAYAVYKLNNKYKFIETEFDQYLEAAIGLIADMVNVIVDKCSLTEAVQVWHLINVFGNEIDNKKLFDGHIREALDGNLTDMLYDLYTYYKNTNQKSLLEYLSSCKTYNGLLDRFKAEEAKEANMQKRPVDRYDSEPNKDNLKHIIKRVLGYFGYEEDGLVLGHLIESFYDTFNFERGICDEAIAAWATLRLTGDDERINDVKRYTPWKLYKLGDVRWNMDEQSACWKTLDAYRAKPILPWDEWMRQEVSRYFHDTFTLIMNVELVNLMAYINVTYDVDKPCSVDQLFRLAYSHMCNDTDYNWLKQSYDHIKKPYTILDYKVKEMYSEFGEHNS